MNQSKHYTAEEIERYHGGQLSRAEMHALEKAALDDPFLADALEGYRHTTTPATDLSQLKQKLQIRIEKESKRRGLFFMNNSWMRVAALFILFAGGGWLVFQLLSGNNAGMMPEVATNQGAKQQPPSATDASADSTSGVVSDAPSSTIPTVTLQQNNDGKPTSNDVALSRPVAGQTESAPVTYSQPKQEQLEERADNLQGIATMHQLNNIDSSSLRDVTAAKEKDNAKAASVDTIRNLNVVMKATEFPANEVVVLNNKSAPQMKRRMYVVIDTLEPAEGWTNFDDYIASNLKTPEEFKSKPIRGEVELSFDVNKAGEPINIAVVKSLCEKCDEEAIRLLKEGPKWKQNKKKGKVKIRF